MLSSRARDRVIECRVAAALLARKLSLPWRGVQRLRHVHVALAAREGLAFVPALELMQRHAESLLAAEPCVVGVVCALLGVFDGSRPHARCGIGAARCRSYTRATVSAALGVGADDADVCALFAALPPSIDRFWARARAMHVFSEALRVEQFEQCCRDAVSG